jgi:hypothetical protein
MRNEKEGRRKEEVKRRKEKGVRSMTEGEGG